MNPCFQLFDGSGTNLLGFQGFADDDTACTFPQICGGSCPEVVDEPCGSKNPHSILIMSTNTSECHGGGYLLKLEVKDKNGELLAAIHPGIVESEFSAVSPHVPEGGRNVGTLTRPDASEASPTGFEPY